MKTYLVTGGAGFIGSNFILYLWEKYQDSVRIINLDKLTYAGNLENLKKIEGWSQYRFVQGDLCDSKLLSEIFDSEEIDYVVNFAAESHVDRSILDPGVFAKTNVLGTLSILNAAKASWQGNEGFRKGVKFLQVSTDEVYGSLGPEGYFTESTPLDPHSPYSASKASADLFVKAYWDTYRFPINITRCSNNYGPYQFPEKLIPLMIHNAVEHQRTSGVWRRPEHPRLALCGGPLQSHRFGAGKGETGRGVQHRRAQRKNQHRHRQDHFVLFEPACRRDHHRRLDCLCGGPQRP